MWHKPAREICTHGISDVAAEAADTQRPVANEHAVASGFHLGNTAKLLRQVWLKYKDLKVQEGASRIISGYQEACFTVGEGAQGKTRCGSHFDLFFNPGTGQVWWQLLHLDARRTVQVSQLFQDLNPDLLQACF